MDQSGADRPAPVTGRPGFLRFVAQRGSPLFGLVLLFWAIDFVLSGWRGWESFAAVLAAALLVGPMAAAIAYAVGAHRPKVRAGVAGVFGLAVAIVFRGLLPQNWPAAGQLACVFALAVGMAILELPPVRHEGAAERNGTPSPSA
jgi:hypothetical protein